MTKYRILIENDDQSYSILADSIEAHGQTGAMRLAAKEIEDEKLDRGVTLVAIPVSNWTEERVRIVAAEPRLVVGADQTIIEGIAEEPEPEAEAAAPEPEAEEAATA